MLNASVAGVTELGDDDLDDLQRALRDRAYRRAYPAAYVGVTVFFFLTLAAWHGDGWLSFPLIIAVDAVVWLAVLSAPVHVLAWTLPDDDEDPQLRLIA